MKRIRLWVAYDGTNYHGWQIQKNGITIESELNRALKELLGEEIMVIGASRTDAGVHALGNVAVFDVDSPIPGEKFSYALNARLPEDIRVTRSEEVAPDWHPRRCESRKTYEYRIYLGEILQPVKRLYCHHVYRPLDIDSMRRAASFLVGEHDFKSFCQENAQVESTIRTICSIEIIKEQNPQGPGCPKADIAATQDPQGPGCPKADIAATQDPQGPGCPKADIAATQNPQGRLGQEGDLVIRVTGNGFLYNMVRIIVGTLLEVGYGRWTPEKIPEILDKRERSAAGPTAPAKGLTLMKYEFPEESCP